LLLVQTRFLSALALVAVSVSVAACGSSSSSSSGNPGGADQVAKTQVAIENATSVQFVDKTSIGSQQQIVTGQFSTTASEEDLQVVGGSKIDVRLIGAVAYVQTTSASTLEGVLGLTQSQAVAASNQWIMLTKADLPYFQIVQAMTIPEVVSIYLPLKSSANLKGDSSVGGTPVVVISGNTTPSSGITAKTTMYLSKATSLPVSGTFRATQGKSVENKSAVFTNWNQPVSVTAPTGAQPLATFKS